MPLLQYQFERSPFIFPTKILFRFCHTKTHPIPVDDTHKIHNDKCERMKTTGFWQVTRKMGDEKCNLQFPNCRTVQPKLSVRLNSILVVGEYSQRNERIFQFFFHVSRILIESLSTYYNVYNVLLSFPLIREDGAKPSNGEMKFKGNIAGVTVVLHNANERCVTMLAIKTKTIIDSNRHFIIEIIFDSWLSLDDIRFLWISESTAYL